MCPISAELPEDWDSTEVKVLVSSNFNEVAMDKTKEFIMKYPQINIQVAKKIVLKKLAGFKAFFKLLA